MAAKDNAWSQEFPVASFTIPSKEFTEEQVVIALKEKDGLQGVGQSSEDPYARAIQYVEKHRILEVFQVRFHTPTPPRCPPI